MKPFLFLVGLLPVLFLSGCDSDDVASGITEGSYVRYGYEDKGRTEIDTAWLLKKTKNTVTFRMEYGFEYTSPKSDFLWIEKIKPQKPMPKKLGE